MNAEDELISAGISFVMVLVICLVIWLCSSCHDNSVWNNGYCDCGGKWQYVEPVGHAYTTSYMYECDKCGKTKEFDKKR